MEKDPLDDFFDGLDANTEAKAGDFSSSDSDDAEKKSKSFITPGEFEDDEGNKNQNDDEEPEYVLPPDHSKITYPPFKRNTTFEQLKDYYLDKADEEEYKAINEIKVIGCEISPVLSFEPYIENRPELENFFKDHSINKPTPVQAQVLPIAINGNNLIVVSPTGTGKTLCFLIPLLYHVLAQGKQEGPTALILSPTELLARQTTLVCHQLIKSTDIKCVELTGNQMKHKQQSSLMKGADVIIGTPGRLMNFLKTVNWQFCTYVVVDEADRIFETGFLRQLRSIMDYIRPDRQTLLFGATLPPQIEELSMNSLKFSTRVQIGKTGAPQSNIEHNFVIFDDPAKKREWIKENLLKLPDGLVLLFVKDKNFCDTLYGILKKITNLITLVHGNMDANQRTAAFNKFRKGECRFLIATEIAARGVDIENINCVVNVDIPEQPESYIHRVGRTARAGRSGTAFTLLTPRDIDSASKLLHHFLLTGIDPPESLIEFVENVQNNQQQMKTPFDE
ncbi:Type III restriction enzyme, res subunit family protein [Trichomonas vaginalis G3]|uniref:Type III restriction enzyme, res subunit family protein n=1 Tax=Trichomonas vaginalis (strain ATCC PRA-98 / G3) TaxID=412133 RepID=A2EPC6_TRIV3|nr:RNA secondary structure unwinding [Trichomonas vaginalis G3]EAY05511.1 Type III restriction enzyme, res subunit family protein [Trichomonas vaginalis G3]KAI5507823.1 RNA secondary structure unwinding [Trichomonas vaginalis G3]|eukprot:XP_001317734.1 Type III restriction enzyme, res subunit family protein [Trichomonas vaginalis G3]